jgi:para-aminobenzoate synthetase / 4-amino-4-deoxychorismate lyase
MPFHPPAPPAPFAVLRDEARRRWLGFRDPVDVCVVHRPQDVLPALQNLERRVETHALHAAGWVSYEAAPGFDPSLAVRPLARPFPLLWFGLFPDPADVDLPPPPAAPPPADPWTADVAPSAYADAFGRIKRHIREGDTYQVNYTHRLRAPFAADPWQAFLSLVQTQPPPPCAAYVSADPWHLCSASPELFFKLDGHRIESHPMKGTAPRRPLAALDRLQAQTLADCPKNRAENLMIVDMVRNDLGRIARPGSVDALALCALQKLPTVWQLVSRVVAETDAPIAECFAALFPPASITGAPKRRTMQIIADLETSPRHAYTGAIGYLAPRRRCQFSVAIRTLTVDPEHRRAEYGVGGGIVWDSDLLAEQAECRAKARILTHPAPPPFSLLETLLWTPADGYHLLERHLARMAESADYFDVPFDEPRIRSALAPSLHAHLPSAPRRIRLLLDPGGAPAVEAFPFSPARNPPPFRIALARRPIDRGDPFLYHKTTRRERYDAARADFPQCDDVVLFNEDGQATESTIANLVVDVDGVLLTPPVECGLLPGTARADLLDRGTLTQGTIAIPQLRSAPRIFLLNSLRGLFPAILQP